MTVTGTAGRVVTVVVMGVSGSGKSTLAQALVERLHCDLAEGDDFHPPANVERMRAGRPLDDADRRPWLASIAAWIGEHERAGRSSVVTCSALRRAYREVLREGHPGVWFVHLDLAPEQLEQRLSRRTGHYMPAALLGSQLSILEPLDADEPGVTRDGDADPGRLADDLVAALLVRDALPASRP